MIGGKFPNIQFQTFYVSKEETNCPLITEFIRISKKLKDLGLLENATATISFSYGKRMLINGNVKDFGNVKREELLEIADYDPIKKILLILGPIEPRVETPVHWMVHHARDDVNAAIQINGKNIVEKFGKKMPETEKDYPAGTLDQAKEILKSLRNSKRVTIKNQGVLFVGSSCKEIEDLALKTHGELK